MSIFSAALPVIRVPGQASQPALAGDARGRILVAWKQQTAGNPAIWLMRWSGTAWEPLGGSASGRGVSQSAGDAANPSLALDSAGDAAVAWEDLTAGNSEIYFRRWNGTSWAEAAGSGSRGGVSATIAGLSVAPALAVDPQGVPLIAWEEHYGSKSDVYVRRLESGWLRTRWVDLGPQPGFIGFPKKIFLSTAPSMALDASGKPNIAYEDDSSHVRQVYFRRWDGRRWQELGNSARGGGISQSSQNCSAPSLALDAAGRPSVAWQEGAAVRQASWNGSRWELQPVFQDPQVRTAWPSAALDSRGRLYVALVVGNKVSVRRRNGPGWSTVQEWTVQGSHPYYQERPMRMIIASERICAAWIEGAPHHGVAAACVPVP